jgi:hypothetical protein
MKLWHDDVRPPPEGWVWARRNQEAQEMLLANEIVECSLDHDLGYHDVVLPDDPDELAEVLLLLRGRSDETGLQLVEWMIEKKLVPPKVTIHSWNPEGARQMAARLNDHGYDCVVQPFRP